MPADFKIISDLIKSQKGNVIFVILTPARNCCATPLFYTHRSQLYTGKQCGEISAAVGAAARALHTAGERGRRIGWSSWVAFTLSEERRARRQRLQTWLEGLIQNAADSKRVGFDINLLSLKAFEYLYEKNKRATECTVAAQTKQQKGLRGWSHINGWNTEGLI